MKLSASILLTAIFLMLSSCIATNAPLLADDKSNLHPLDEGYWQLCSRTTANAVLNLGWGCSVLKLTHLPGNASAVVNAKGDATKATFTKLKAPGQFILEIPGDKVFNHMLVKLEDADFVIGFSVACRSRDYTEKMDEKFKELRISFNKDCLLMGESRESLTRFFEALSDQTIFGLAVDDDLVMRKLPDERGRAAMIKK